MWRLEPAKPTVSLMIEATNDHFVLPEKGLVGRHAIFDPAMLDTPRIDDAFRTQQDERTWKVSVKRRNTLSTVTFPSIRSMRSAGMATSASCASTGATCGR